jgi:hypothetical protein
VNPSPIIRVVPRRGGAAVGTVAIAPIEVDSMARAGALIGPSSSGPGSSKRVGSRGNGVSLGAVEGRTGPRAGRSRTAALQAGVVVSAPEELGALPPRLGSDGQNSARDPVKARRSGH